MLLAMIAGGGVMTCELAAAANAGARPAARSDSEVALPSRAAGAAVPALAPAAAPPARDLRPTLRDPVPLEPGVLRGGEGVFGSVPLPVTRIGLSDRWGEIASGAPERMLAACVADVRRCSNAFEGRLNAIASATAPAEQAGLWRLRAVNRIVNEAIRYQTDPQTWGEDDYWASPAETLARGAGDCEDYALLKLAALAALGWEPTDLSVVVVKDLRRGIGHAVLAVRQGASYAVLDNVTDAVLSDTDIRDYLPLYSIGPAGSWIHGKRRAAPTPVREARRGEPGPAAALRGSLN